MQKLKIKKLEGTIAYIEGLELEQINTADFIIFRVDTAIDTGVVREMAADLKAKGIKKTFLILPKSVEYCVFKNEEES